MAVVSLFADSTSQQTLTDADIFVLGEGVTLATDPTAITGQTGGSAEYVILGHAISGNDDAIKHSSATTAEILVGATGSLSALGSNAIDVHATESIALENYGQISATSGTTVLLQDTDGDADITVFNAGGITMSNIVTALHIDAGTGSAFLENSGSIQSAADAVKILGTPSEVYVVNSGTIFGNNIALRAFNTPMTLTNSGTISSHKASGLLLGAGGDVVNSGTISTVDGDAIDASAATTLQNTGSVIGDIDLSSSADIVTNTGLIQGEVFLGNGNDHFTSALGQVQGYVDGGAGNDTLKGSALDDNMGGGTGEDELRGMKGDDALYGEDGADDVFGGQGDDILLGDEGADRLKGGKDDDTLEGGADADILTGGRGADIFVFVDGDAGTKADADVITDFTRKEDKIDLSSIPDITLLTTGGFSASGAPEAKLKKKKGDLLVLIDEDGDGTADMQITVEGLTKLAAGDFIL